MPCSMQWFPFVQNIFLITQELGNIFCVLVENGLTCFNYCYGSLSYKAEYMANTINSVVLSMQILQLSDDNSSLTWAEGLSGAPGFHGHSFRVSGGGKFQ